MKKRLLILFSAVVMVAAANAQNLKLSQYSEAPTFYNPAAAGKFEGKVRVATLYSNQSADSAKLNHALLSADYRLKRDNSSWGVGVSYYQSFHPAFLMSSKYVSATIARHLFVDEDDHHMLSAGLQIAYAAAFTNVDKPAYNEEISGGGFKVVGDPATKSASYADINIGGMYTYKSETLTVETGLAAYHITSPTYTLNKTKVHQPRRLDFTINANIFLNYNNELHLSTMMWRAGFRNSYQDPPTNEYIYSAMMETFLGETTAIYYGLSTRSANSITPLAGFGLKNNMLRIKASYELPINKEAYDIRRAELSAVLTL